MNEYAFVKGQCFFHYCHKNKQLMCLRSWRLDCPFCGYKNPVGDKRTVCCHVVTDYENRPVMVFDDYFDAIDFMQEYPDKDLILHDAGLIRHGTKSNKAYRKIRTNNEKKEIYQITNRK